MSSTPPESRPGALGEREIAMLERFAGILAALQRPGASVHTTDSRFDKLQLAFVGISVTGIMGLFAWNINGLVEHGLLIREIVTQQQAMERRIERLEERKP